MRADEARIQSPCTEDLTKMQKDGIDVFCSKCEKTVYDLSERTEVEARRLLALPSPRCVRYKVKKATGELLFATALLTSGLATAPMAYAAGAVPSLIPEITESTTTDEGNTEGSTDSTTQATDPNQTSVPEVVTPVEPEATVVPVEPEPEYYMMAGGLG